jgi:hypothetical protein
MANELRDGKPNPARSGKDKRHRSSKKRSRLLSLLGAVIVFVTFVANEGLREKLKDSLDSVSEGVSMFLLRADNNLLAGQLEAIRQDTLAPLREKPGAQVSDKQVVDFMGRLHVRLRERMEGINTSLDNASRLLRSMNKADNDLADLQVRFTALNASLGQLETVWLNDVHAEARHEPIPSGDPVKLLSFVDASLEAGSLEIDVHRLANRLLTTADGWREVQAKKYDRAKWVSYLLYVTGWGVGLVGTLYGDEATGVDAG